VAVLFGEFCAVLFLLLRIWGAVFRFVHLRVGLCEHIYHARVLALLCTQNHLSPSNTGALLITH
jgi:hypothetical protein